MSRITGPKARLCRAYGINLFGSPKYDKILADKPYGPGMHGGARKRKSSQFGSQLKSKQIARIMFGLSEKQFSKYVAKATTKTGDTEGNLIKELETRADNIVYKSGFGKTIFQARQFVNHGHFMLNGKKIMTPSIQLRVGDVLEVRENKKKMSVYQTLAKLSVKEMKIAPTWLKAEPQSLRITVLELPTKDHFDPIIQTKPIIEYYSR